MEKREPRLSDEDLRFAREQGLTPSQIAQQYGLSRQAVHERVKRMALTTTALSTVAPLESRRYVNIQVDILAELGRSLHRVNLLFDACDTWLRDANDPSAYDIGPRANEVQVTYWDNSGDSDEPTKAKASLAELLNRIDDGGILTIRAEYKVADPRELVLKTAQEVRQTVQSATELAKLLADARAMERFREAMLSAIQKVDPTVAQAIAEAVRSVVVLHTAAA